MPLSAAIPVNPDTLVQGELPFEGFKRFVQDPLQINDPLSFERIKSILLNFRDAPQDPFRLLIEKLASKVFAGREAKEHWQRIIRHKQDMEAKLGRRVCISVAALDYFDVIGTPKSSPLCSLNDVTPLSDGVNREDWINRIYAPGYHLEKLKEEMQRARRYKHALSMILLDVDGLGRINQEFSYKIGDEILTIIVKIIKKTVRAVDILTRYSGDRFLLILPDTNTREATELAERLRTIIHERTKRIKGLARGVTVTLSVGQSSRDDKSAEFMKHLELALEDGKKHSRNAVYVCDCS
jgi:diguanylate cyclase (GGDEF)-like protein